MVLSPSSLEMLRSIMFWTNSHCCKALNSEAAAPRFSSCFLIHRLLCKPPSLLLPERKKGGVGGGVEAVHLYASPTTATSQQCLMKKKPNISHRVEGWGWEEGTSAKIYYFILVSSRLH